ncbi:YtxH domain-containing protein [Jeotgalibacillus terrae]|uniref:YtxH domain-containing protein n=1 Tax=Jeotgalibacillus terrae TaxID=587735 RepID=A0ABW5ZM46_9BACL|nr:YtxH domain-containing protein [Jeotgalibacillus terrae]MBM7578978.1 gas vesicle protein [Jeotgalibacillus terrae]
MEKNNNSRDFVLGALIGSIAGAVTALFLAPKSGGEFRQELNTQAGRLKDRSYEWKDQAVTKSSEMAALAKEKSAVISKNVQDQSSGVMDKVKSLRSKDKQSEQAPQLVTAKDPSLPTVHPVDPLTPPTSEEPLRTNR